MTEQTVCPACPTCLEQYWRANKRLISTEYITPNGMENDSIELDDVEFLCANCGEAAPEGLGDKIESFYYHIANK